LLAAPPSTSRTAPASLLVVGDILFTGDAGRPSQSSQSYVALRPTIDDGDAKRQLPGTKTEMVAIHKLFNEAMPRGTVRELSGSAPTEQAIRDLAPQSTYIHLATHGYFGRAAQGAAPKPGEQNPLESFGVAGAGDSVASMQPDLLCGVCLVGFKRQAQQDRDDGILTALEVKALDLDGVDMVTLGACQTGLGIQVDSEGVLGLQRAFQLAGARSTVTTLWSVSDDATQALMTDFYSNLWAKKQSRIEALRQAQLTMLRDGGKRGLKGVKPENAEKRLPPFFWAGFVLSGDWR
jgi:CHAT domain-containing protein